MEWIVKSWHDALHRKQISPVGVKSIIHEVCMKHWEWVQQWRGDERRGNGFMDCVDWGFLCVCVYQHWQDWLLTKQQCLTIQ